MVMPVMSELSTDKPDDLQAATSAGLDSLDPTPTPLRLGRQRGPQKHLIQINGTLSGKQGQNNPLIQ